MGRIAKSGAPRLPASRMVLAPRWHVAVRGVCLGILRNLVRLATLWPPSQRQRRPRTGEHDSGDAPFGVLHTVRTRRARSRPDTIRAPIRHQQLIGIGLLHGQAHARSAVRPAAAGILAMVGRSATPKPGAESILTLGLCGWLVVT